MKPNRMRIFRALATVALCLAFLASCRLLEEETPSIEVMSFNIRYGLADDGPNSWSHRRHLVFGVLESHRPVIVGLQEALDFQIDEILAEMPAYASIGIGREADGGGEYAAILYSKKSFELLERDTFWLSDTPETPSASWGNKLFRICTWARFRHRASDQELYVYNTHFDHRSEESREQSAHLIAERIAGRKHSNAPFILMGDFNAGEDTIPIEVLLNREGKARMLDTYRALYPNESSAGTFGAWEGRTEGDKIDYVFADSRMDVLDAAIVRDNAEGRYPSDHYPVTARVGF